MPVGKTIQHRFYDFCAAHPDVYWRFRGYAYEAKYAGFRRFSAHAIIQRIRWFHSIDMREGDHFKINDQFAGRFARWLAAVEPQVFVDFFEFRRIKTP